MRTSWRSAWRRWRGSPAPRADDRPAVVLTTVNAVLQRVVPREIVAKQSLSAAAGTLLPMARVTQWLELNGFTRAATVREPGDYAVRGGIVDLFAPGMDAPVRLDFFGDTLESIRRFDPETQRTTDELRALELVPMAEFQLTAETIRQFRTGYVAAFGAAAPDDMLYEAVSDGRRSAGVEHWLPLFHPHLDTLFDYLGGSSSPHPPLEGEGRERSERGGVTASPSNSPPPGALARADLPPPGGGEKRAATPSFLSRWRRKPRTSGWRKSPIIIRRARTRSIRPVPARPISRCRRTGSICPKPNGASAWKNRRWRGCRRSPRRKAPPMRSRSAPAPGTTSPPSGASPAPMSSRR